MAEIMCHSPLIRGSEFVLNDQGVRLFGTCGQRALASASASVVGHQVSTLGIYDQMRARGWADPGGASTIGDLRNEAQLMGIPIASFVQYNEPWNSWQSWLSAQIMGSTPNPCTIELAYGQALFDTISQRGENAVGLRYHFIAVLGRNTGGWSPLAGRNLPAGWWCADGDSFAGNNDNAHGFNADNVLQYYTDAVMAAARPCGGLALKGRAVKVAWTKQADGTGKDAQGHTCGAGMMATLESLINQEDDGLLSETYYTATESFLPLSSGHVYSWDGKQVSTDRSAQVLVNVWDQLQAAQKALKGASPLPPTPNPTPTLTAQQTADLKVMADLRAALATA